HKTSAPESRMGVRLLNPRPVALRAFASIHQTEKRDVWDPKAFPPVGHARLRMCGFESTGEIDGKMRNAAPMTSNERSRRMGERGTARGSRRPLAHSGRKQ